MARLAAAIALTVLTPALVGCVGLSNEVLGCHGVDVGVFTHQKTAEGIQRAEDQPVSVGVWVENNNDAPVRVYVETDPAGVVVSTGNTTNGTDPATAVLPEVFDQAFFPVQITDPPNNGSLRISVTTTGADTSKEAWCELDRTEHERIRLGEPENATRAAGGSGVLVHTVGWFTDGEPFYGNLPRYENHTQLPRVHDYGGPDPLKVYVYNESSDEMPDRYNESGYVTTIPGFNEALKGLATTGGKIVHLEPEEAYTREGYEDHVLYGEALVFYIEAVEVRTVPCEVPQPVCTLPGPSDVSDPAIPPR